MEDVGNAGEYSRSRERGKPAAWRAPLLRRGLPQAQLAQRAVDPQPRELFLHAILGEARAQIVEVDAIEILILVEAGEHHALHAGGGIAVDLQALGADLFHHALHRRVDGGDGLMSWLEMLREDARARPFDR